MKLKCQENISNERKRGGWTVIVNENLNLNRIIVSDKLASKPKYMATLAILKICMAANVIENKLNKRSLSSKVSPKRGFLGGHR